MITRQLVRQDVCVYALLALLSLAAFARAAGFGFVGYDDDSYVSANPWVMRGITWDGAKWAFTALKHGTWQPVTWLSFMLDAQLGRADPRVFHASNILLHTANVLLLYAFLARATGSRTKSAFVAALFAVHPMRVESVVWIAERKDVLSSLFFLLALLAYLRLVRRRSTGGYALLAALYALGLMCKPMLMTLPAALLLLDYWPLSRFGALRNPGGGLVRLLWEKAPLIAMAAASGAITLAAQRQAGAVVGLAETPLGVRTANALAHYWLYIGKTLWPRDLAVIYPYAGRSLPEWAGPAAGIGLAAVTAAAIVLRRTAPYMLTGWAWFVITLVPVAGFVRIGAHGIADRFTYLPHIGFFIIVAWGVPHILARLPRRRAAAALMGSGAVAAVAVCLALTIAYVGCWRSGLELFRHAAACTPSNPIALNGCGSALGKMGRRTEAMRYFRRALEISPLYADAANNLGLCYLENGDLLRAQRAFEAAAKGDPKNDVALYNLGYISVQRSRLTDAEAFFKRALDANAENTDALIGLANIYSIRGNAKASRELYERALRIQPRAAEAHYGLAMLLTEMGRHKEAERHYKASLSAKFRVFESANNLAWIYATSPDFRLRNPAEALRLARQALRTGADDVSALDTLAAAYAASGNFAAAVRAQRNAIDRLGKEDSGGLRRQFESRLRLYLAGKAYVQTTH